MLNTYNKLEKIVLPELKNFYQDLTVCDKNILKKYKGKFLYGYRNSGTNLFLLDAATFDYKKSMEQLQTHLSNHLHLLKGNNKNFLFFNGEDFEKINWEELHVLFGMFAKTVYQRKNKIDSLNIEAIAFDLWNLMSYDRKWKEKILESSSDSLRRLRNHFDYHKLKKTNDLAQLKLDIFGVLSC